MSESGALEPRVDTIAAVATPPGLGAVALIRISGPEAFRILAAVGGDPTSAQRTAVLCTVRDPRSGDAVDQVLATRFPAPASYTGEDVVELSTHGGALAPRLVLEALIAAGARLAEPGEFTRRAWIGGKLDLVQAEAVHDLIEGRSRAIHRTALHQLDRGLSARVSALRERLVRLEALLVHHIDFPEEDDAPTPVEEIAERAELLAGELATLLGTAAEGVLLRRGALAVLAGPPNAGKSSLLNALAGEERALVTEVAGTTRDAIEVEVSLGGYPFRVVDTAGLRASEDRMERLGIEVAERYLGGADLILYCAENEADVAGLRALLGEVEAPVVVIRTKVDLEGPMYGERRGDGAFGFPADDARIVGVLGVSAHSGAGLKELRQTLRDLVFGGLASASDDAPVLTRARQADAARAAMEEVEGFADALRAGIPPEVASAHLRAAGTALESLLGVVTREEVLDALFDSFCIGK